MVKESKVIACGEVSKDIFPYDFININTSFNNGTNMQRFRKVNKGLREWMRKEKKRNRKRGAGKGRTRRGLRIAF